MKKYDEDRQEMMKIQRELAEMANRYEASKDNEGVVNPSDAGRG